MTAHKAHRVRPEGRHWVVCQWDIVGPGCDKPADVCHHRVWAESGGDGISFYYYCDEHGTTVELTAKAYPS